MCCCILLVVDGIRQPSIGMPNAGRAALPCYGRAGSGLSRREARSKLEDLAGIRFEPHVRIEKNARTQEHQ